MYGQCCQYRSIGYLAEVMHCSFISTLQLDIYLNKCIFYKLGQTEELYKILQIIAYSPNYSLYSNTKIYKWHMACASFFMKFDVKWGICFKNHTLWYKAQLAGSRHNTALIPNKFTRCLYNIQKHSLGIVFVLFAVVFVVCACRKSTWHIFILFFNSMSVSF